MSTFGPSYEFHRDEPRLTDQRETIKTLMLDGIWRTLPEIHQATRYPEASISAQLRHLRKPRFGGYTVEKRRVNGGGLYEYRVIEPAPTTQSELFGAGIGQ